MPFTRTSSRYADLNAALVEAAKSCTDPLAAITVDQLLRMQHMWTTRLSARLDQAIEDAAGDQPALIEAVASAWRQLAAEAPTLRHVLDTAERTRDLPPHAVSEECRILALAAGIADLDDPAADAVQSGHRYRAAVHSGRASPAADFPTAAA